eukprot:gene9137-18930_t
MLNGLLLIVCVLAVAGVRTVECVESLLGRMSRISTAITTNLNYLMLKPVKAGNIIQFTAGALKNAPCNEPVFSLSSDDAPSAAKSSSTQQLIWATYKLTGLTNYLGLEKGGAFRYHSFSSSKMCDIYGYRSNDPAYCNETISTLSSDRIYPSMSNCEQELYVDSNGHPLQSFINRQYDPRIRPWYISAKNYAKASWSPVYVFFDDFKLGITYTIPMYDSSSTQLLGVIGLDYHLITIETMLNEIKIPDKIQYIFVSSTSTLIATSTGETVGSADGTRMKVITEADNTMIRESGRYIIFNSITTDGFYSYKSATDGRYYILQLTTWRDDTNTIDWKIVVVTYDTSTSTSRTYGYDITSIVLDATQDSKHISDCILSDLDSFIDDAIYPAKYVAFLTGNLSHTPLSKPLIELINVPSKIGVTQRTLWGLFSSFPNSNTVWVGFANKAMVVYNKIAVTSLVTGVTTFSQSYFYKSVSSPYLAGYTVSATDGIPSTTVVFNKSYDPTLRPWYTAATGSGSWGKIAPLSFAPDVPVIAFTMSIFGINSTKIAVVGITRKLSRFTELLVPYTSTTGVSYILDTNNNLIATSTNEIIWLNNALKPATSSSNLMIKETAQFLITNQINTDNVFSVTISTGAVLSVTLRFWTDLSGSLRLRIITATILLDAGYATPTPSPVSSSSSSSSSSGSIGSARDAAIAAAIFSSLIFVLVIYIAYISFNQSLSQSQSQLVSQQPLQLQHLLPQKTHQTVSNNDGNVDVDDHNIRNPVATA